MRSSTSGSDRWRPAARASAVLIAGCLCLAAFTEAMVRVGFDRVSRIQRRTVTEYAAAVRTAADDRPVALFLGNSLLDEGVEFEALRGDLEPDWDARRFVVEQTFYNDWYYGLRRLFREHARPSIVVLVLTPRQWIRDDLRGDYSAQYLMTTADALAATRELHMAPTRAASFVLASMSKFWGARAEIRNWVLGRIMPDFGNLMSYSSVVDPTVLHDDEVARVVRERLERCRDLARAHGAHLIVLIPPVLDPADGSRGLIEAGRQAGVLVLEPVPSGQYPAAFYRDAGFHLNAEGARRFTTALASPLRAAFDATGRGELPRRAATASAERGRRAASMLEAGRAVSGPE